MNPEEWGARLQEFATNSRMGGAFEVAEAQRALLGAAGSILVQKDNATLGKAFLNGTLDAGTVLRTLRQNSVPYMDPDTQKLCREIGDMRTPFEEYVLQMVHTSGWTLNDNSSNMTFLYHALEFPTIVDNHPTWFEDVVAKHPWAWRHVFDQQFFMEDNSTFREFLYEPTRKPWESAHTVEKMVGWLYYWEAEAPEKAAAATEAWPEWMAHLRSYLHVHYQVMGAPDSDWDYKSVWATRYFKDVAGHVLQHWKPTISETWDCAGLLTYEP